MNNKFKKVLCKTYLVNNNCKYLDMCKFAHGLEDQKIDFNRDCVYRFLNLKNYKKINIFKDFSLYKSLLELTKICKECEINKCPGGINCNSGSYCKELCICINDLNYGKCNKNCDKIHLTKKGLLPFYHSSHFKKKYKGILYKDIFNKDILKIKKKSLDSKNSIFI